MDRWITHDGSGTPDLSKGTQVIVRMRDGVEFHSPEEFNWWGPDDSDGPNYWTHTGEPSDIVAYAVVES